MYIYKTTISSTILSSLVNHNGCSKYLKPERNTDPHQKLRNRTVVSTRVQIHVVSTQKKWVPAGFALRLTKVLFITGGVLNWKFKETKLPLVRFVGQGSYYSDGTETFTLPFWRWVAAFWNPFKTRRAVSTFG